MRRVGNLFEAIAAPENVRLAFYKAARGKRAKPTVRDFSSNLDERILRISTWIRNGDFPLGRIQQFTIRDPKERTITAPCFDERVLHHAIMNICEPLLDRWLIDDTYACRTGKGREAAVQRAHKFSQHRGWFLKLDIRKYFDTIAHEKLRVQLSQRFKDARLLELLGQVIFCYRGKAGIGLPIGSLTSQHFANLYLGWFDRFVKETLKVVGYVRYMDDMILWHDDVNELRSNLLQSRAYLRDVLALELKPNVLQRTSVGVEFLGCRIWPTHVELNRRSKSRWRLRVVVLERARRLGLLSELAVQVRLNSQSAFAISAGTKSWRFRQAMLKRHAVDDP